MIQKILDGIKIINLKINHFFSLSLSAECIRGANHYCCFKENSTKKRLEISTPWSWISNITTSHRFFVFYKIILSES